MKIILSPLQKLTSVIVILLIISTIVNAKDNDGKENKREKSAKEQVNINTKQDIGEQVQMKYVSTTDPNSLETEEDRANWYISENLPKPEKVCKKEQIELDKINRKIIKKERKECKKLQRSIKKGEFQTNSE
jgi:hypothetical protein